MSHEPGALISQVPAPNPHLPPCEDSMAQLCMNSLVMQLSVLQVVKRYLEHRQRRFFASTPWPSRFWERQKGSLAEMTGTSGTTVAVFPG